MGFLYKAFGIRDRVVGGQPSSDVESVASERSTPDKTEDQRDVHLLSEAERKSLPSRSSLMYKVLTPTEYDFYVRVVLENTDPAEAAKRMQEGSTDPREINHKKIYAEVLEKLRFYFYITENPQFIESSNLDDREKEILKLVVLKKKTYTELKIMAQLGNLKNFRINLTNWGDGSANGIVVQIFREAFRKLFSHYKSSKG